MTRALPLLLLILAGCVAAESPPPPPSIGDALQTCIARAQAADAAGQYEAGRAWWREAGRVVYARPCRNSLAEVLADRSEGSAG